MILCDLNQGYGVKLKYSSLDVFAVKSFFAGQLIQKIIQKINILPSDHEFTYSYKNNVMSSL